MGKGTIASGGADGLYQVTLDYGDATRTAQVDKITTELAALVVKIADAQALYDAQLAIEDAQKVVVDAAVNTYITVTNAVGPALAAVSNAQAELAALQADPFATPDAIAAAQSALSAANAAYASAKAAIEPALKNYTEAAAELATLKSKTAALRIPLELLKAYQVQLTKDQTTWTGLNMTETVPAWCVDLTEGATGDVATIEIPGENKLVLIAPAAPPPGPADGLLTAREVQSPAQVFWNAAVLPGWQKWKPTYRRGTITALDYDADTANVTLDNDVSSAQGLSINQTSTLTAIPVEYMQCDANAFEVGDRCVVKFTGQDWAAPKVIGFCDNPKPCLPEFVDVFYGTLVIEMLEITGTRPFVWVYTIGPEYSYANRYDAAAPIRGRRVKFLPTTWAPSSPLGSGLYINLINSTVAHIPDGNINPGVSVPAGSEGIVYLVKTFNGGLINVEKQTTGVSMVTVKRYNSAVAPEVTGGHFDGSSTIEPVTGGDVSFKGYMESLGAVPTVTITNGIKNYSYELVSTSGPPAEFAGNILRFKYSGAVPP